MWSALGALLLFWFASIAALFPADAFLLGVGSAALLSQCRVTVCQLAAAYAQIPTAQPVSHQVFARVTGILQIAIQGKYPYLYKSKTLICLNLCFTQGLLIGLWGSGRILGWKPGKELMIPYSAPAVHWAQCFLWNHKFRLLAGSKLGAKRMPG